MAGSLFDGVRCWRELRRFQSLPAASRTLVCYAEDPGSWPHLGPIVDRLTGPLGREVCYLTSSRSDPVLQRKDPHLHAFFIGSGTIRTMAFLTLDARVLFMTMPDLHTFHIKRSRVAAVHYAYVFHSMVSTHMIYRPAAFDHFDTLLAVGPHHIAEVRAREATLGLPAKALVECGYARLDTILAEAAARSAGAQEPARGPGPPHVLIAPSWGPSGVLELQGETLVRALLDAGWRVTVRPHPATSQHHPALVPGLRAAFGDDRLFAIDGDMASRESLHASDVMISDWSGAALEYSFGLEKPVLFLDLPRKVNNPDYQALGIVPVEVSLRDEIGAVLAPDRLDLLPDALRDLIADRTAQRERIVAARERTVWHLGRSAEVAAAELVRLAAPKATEISPGVP